eukprot:TRINITY_DN18931_c0_g1_i1.p1 TRINITY_DN18931_c0_g1~~TRINITY_DN18931_c0_g1_i1.p1  ORF type:complete len:356 (-),score=88.11 TRINITY_DN18931_c0_g1_i1:126-1193(-)
MNECVDRKNDMIITTLRKILKDYDEKDSSRQDFEREKELVMQQPKIEQRREDNSERVKRVKIETSDEATQNVNVAYTEQLVQPAAYLLPNNPDLDQEQKNTSRYLEECRRRITTLRSGINNSNNNTPNVVSLNATPATTTIRKRKASEMVETHSPSEGEDDNNNTNNNMDLQDQDKRRAALFMDNININSNPNMLLNIQPVVTRQQINHQPLYSPLPTAPLVLVPASMPTPIPNNLPYPPPISINSITFDPQIIHPNPYSSDTRNLYELSDRGMCGVFTQEGELLASGEAWEDVDLRDRRERVTTEQKHILERAFLDDQLPSKKTKERLAQKLGISVKRIQTWFQNRRAKEKLCK